MVLLQIEWYKTMGNIENWGESEIEYEGKLGVNEDNTVVIENWW